MKRIVSLAAVLILASLAPAATVEIDPASITVRGGTFDLDVRITDVIDLYAYQFDVVFDPAVLHVISASEGAFLAGGGGTFFVPGVPGNGVITFTAGTLLGPVPGVSGSGTLATIRFSAHSLGTSAITPSNVVLLDSALGDILAEVEGGSVTAIPEPNSGFLLGSVIGLGLISRYWLIQRWRTGPLEGRIAGGNRSHTDPD